MYEIMKDLSKSRDIRDPRLFQFMMSKVGGANYDVSNILCVGKGLCIFCLLWYHFSYVGLSRPPKSRNNK